MPFLDEVASGMAPACAPDIAHSFRVPAGYAAAALLVAFGVVSFVLEPPILAWSERARVRFFAAGSLAAIALASVIAAFATRPFTLVFALAAYGPAAGCALAAAEGTLVVARPHESDRTLARLGVSASLGDLAVPLILAALAVVGLGWRAGFVAAAVMAGIVSVILGTSRALEHPPVSVPDEDDAGPAGLRDTLSMVWRSRELRAWVLATTFTSLLDEVLVAFAAIHLDALGSTGFQRSIALAAWTLAGLAALVVLERRSGRFDPHALLLTASVASGVGLVLLAVAPSVWLGTFALAGIGATGAVLHPLAKARAYEALPGRPAIVNAALATCLPIELIAPAVVGVLAVHTGSGIAVASLLVAPVAIVAAVVGRRGKGRGG